MESTVYAITDKLLLHKVCNNHTSFTLYQVHVTQNVMLIIRMEFSNTSPSFETDWWFSA